VRAFASLAGYSVHGHVVVAVGATEVVLLDIHAERVSASLAEVLPCIIEVVAFRARYHSLS
jgi:hypothetical protein